MENNKKDTRQMFSAVFEKYEPSGAVGNKTHFSDVRVREGGVIKKHLVFENSVKVPTNYSLGEYVAFLADVEFKNVEFMNIFEVG
jgi:hypothetical protein